MDKSCLLILGMIPLDMLVLQKKRHEIGIRESLLWTLFWIPVFVGIKMLIADLYKIPVSIALAVVGGILCISIALSLMIPPKKQI